MPNGLDRIQKFKLTLRVQDVISSDTPVSLDDFIEDAVEALGCDVTQNNVQGACQTVETTLAKVFAKPADLVKSLKDRVAALEAEVTVLTELLIDARAPEKNKAWATQVDGIRMAWSEKSGTSSTKA